MKKDNPLFVYVGVPLTVISMAFLNLAFSDDSCEGTEIYEESEVACVYDEVRLGEVRQCPEEYLYERLIMEGIKEPDIVYAIAMLETGNFTSRLCVEDNNLFGLYDSANKCYYKFDDWHDCVKAYKELVESKYKGGDYYKFLKDLPYSEDADYIEKLKAMVVQIRKI